MVAMGVMGVMGVGWAVAVMQVDYAVAVMREGCAVVAAGKGGSRRAALCTAPQCLWPSPPPPPTMSCMISRAECPCPPHHYWMYSALQLVC